MKTETNKNGFTPTLLEAFNAMNKKKKVIISESLRKDVKNFLAEELEEELTINSIECSGDVTLFSENCGVIYDVKLEDFIINQNS